MPSHRLSMRHACMFMENAFLELLDILAWQEGMAPTPSACPHGLAEPLGASREMVSPDRGREPS
ncbi:hypothetical protein [Komagataeibacter sp. FXV3]|uniref:hypothetical protein n=1 Tax=Komagataeibacter sp. FXV3 TaxID=2608998 RepID=UPI00187B8F64|nr:hypothetical protein [Komagataeibacter sp. FXV3]